MKNAIAWARSNFLVVISAIVAIVAVAGLFMANAHANQTKQDVEQQAKRDIGKMKGLLNTKIPLPPDKPGGESQEETILINQHTINTLGRMFQRMNGQYDKIFHQAQRINRLGVTAHRRYANNELGHMPMMEGLFPQFKDQAIPYTARHVYGQAFKTMLGKYSPESLYPNMDSGMPPTMEQIQQELEDVVNETLSRNMVNAANELDEEQAESLHKDLVARTIELVTQKARSIHIYATQPVATNPDDTEASNNSSLLNFPPEIAFDVGAWSVHTQKAATVEEIWEGQVGLWIQQDIVEAIARMNQVENDNVNVMTAPIKHLIKIEVVPGYLGIQTMGELTAQAQAGPDVDQPATPGQPGMFGGGRPGMMSPMGMRGMGGMPGMGMRGMGPEMGMRGMGMMGGLFDDEDEEDSGYQPVIATEGDEPLDEDFSISPTGRRSNAIYDVRQVSVTLIMDAQRMPEFFDILGKVNFMTVLKMRVRDVDEYEALRSGFVYGNDDAIEVKALIETIWLRQWTAPYMPNTIGSLVGVLQPDDEGYVDPMGLQGQGLGPAGMMPGMMRGPMRP